MKDELIHIRVGKKLKERMQLLIDIGLYSNQAELTREALRVLLLKYNDELVEALKRKNEKD